MAKIVKTIEVTELEYESIKEAASFFAALPGWAEEYKKYSNMYERLRRVANKWRNTIPDAVGTPLEEAGKRLIAFNKKLPHIKLK